ncbi:MAG: hypothetical protein GXP62_09600 [Oligoflexia bacterium]|nr:hypothetical protein [Oligoflexia bacterium]
MTRSLVPEPASTHPDFEDWRRLVQRDLRGADFAQRLVHSRVDGLETWPLYTHGDAPPPRRPPGHAPWIRGRFDHGRWQAWQVVDARDPAQAASLAADELGTGAHGLVIPVDATGARGQGVVLQRAGDLLTLLRGLPLVRTWISLMPGADFLSVGAAFIRAVQLLGVSDADVRGVIGADPVSVLAQTGRLDGGSLALAWLGDLAAWCGARMPGLRVAVADTRAWHEAGASDVDQLALALATAVTYLRAIEGAGASLPVAFGQISFRLRLGPELLQGVAQVRALRGLWGRVAQACGLDGDPSTGAYIHVLPGHRSLTRRDPFMNLLRNTAVAFAGATGGADAVTTLSFDSECAGTHRSRDRMARRLARNTQTILAAESHLDRVADPAGGSYFIERRTTELMKAAWARFQQIEAAKGVIPALESGLVQAWVDAAWSERARRVACRQTLLTGVSAFPDLAESALAESARPGDADPVSPSPPVAAERGMVRLAGPGSGALTDSILTALTRDELGLPLSALTEIISVDAAVVTALPLSTRRLAEPFEAMRDRSDACKAATGSRPAVFLALLGVAAHTRDQARARAGLARTLLATGGLDVVEASWAEQGGAGGLVQAFRDGGCAVVVLCGSDASYRDDGVTLERALRAAGASQVWSVALAGSGGQDSPGAADPASWSDGVLSEACDLVKSLDRIWQEVRP